MNDFEHFVGVYLPLHHLLASYAPGTCVRTWSVRHNSHSSYHNCAISFIQFSMPHATCVPINELTGYNKPPAMMTLFLVTILTDSVDWNDCGRISGHGKSAHTNTT